MSVCTCVCMHIHRKHTYTCIKKKLRQEVFMDNSLQWDIHRHKKWNYNFKQPIKTSFTRKENSLNLVSHIAWRVCKSAKNTYYINNIPKWNTKFKIICGLILFKIFTFVLLDHHQQLYIYINLSYKIKFINVENRLQILNITIPNKTHKNNLPNTKYSNFIFQNPRRKPMEPKL